jgi:predicted AAA+ superfamily ATPase
MKMGKNNDAMKRYNAISMYGGRILSSRYVENIKNDLLDLVKNKVKDHFGKEFYITDSLTNSPNNKYLFDWLKKYDKEFEVHYSKHSESITDFIKLISVTKDTFIYIVTGNKIDRYNIYNLINTKDNRKDYDMYVYICGKRARKYIKEFEKLMELRNTMNRSNKIYIVNEVSNQGYSNINVIDLKKRETDTLYFSHGEMDKIIKHIDHFESTKEMYADKQLLYKTGILLYGEPGTGKSSLANAIATKYKRSIITISMNKVSEIDFGQLTLLINNDDLDTYIILMEDIDTLFLNREDEKATDKNYNDIINQLLQFLDSNTSPNNVIFVATTNHVDKLDAALLREGRFDLKIEVEGLDNNLDINRMIKSFGISEDKIPSILDDYKKAIGEKFDGVYNQSKLQSIIIKYIE